MTRIFAVALLATALGTAAAPGPAAAGLIVTFDFDDAQIGDGQYDLAAAGLIVFAGQPAPLAAFLRAYGCPADALGRPLGRRLLAYTLLHRYRPMSWWLAAFAPAGPTTLDELAAAIYPLGQPGA